MDHADSLSPAHQLFIQETLELLSQIDMTLQQLLQNPSSSAIDSLLLSVQPIQEGADSLEFARLHETAQQFETLTRCLHRDPIIITAQQVETLRQASKTMQATLSCYIPTSPKSMSSGIKPNFSNTDLDFELENRDSSAELFSVSASEPLASQAVASEKNVTALILTTDVAEILDQLQQALSNPQVYDLTAELKTHSESLLGWGEVLELSEFVTIAQSTIEMLMINPQAAYSIGQLSLAGFRSAYNTALQAEGVPLDDDSEAIFTSPQSLRESRGTIAEIPTAESFNLDQEVTLNTTLLFVWQQNRLLFMIPSDAVIEILIPRTEQMMGNGNQCCLSWQDQYVPFHRLTDLYNQEQHELPPLSAGSTLGSTSAAATFGLSPVLIIQQGGRTMALEVSINRLITEPELILQPPTPPQQTCSYFSGETVLENNQPYAVIDIALLLNETLGLNPLSKPKGSAPGRSGKSTSLASPPSSSPKRPPSQTTVLVVDDSRTVRQMVTMVLESSGYQVIQAIDGQQAIEKLEEHSVAVQLIVCDVEMPNMNGFEFLESRIRKPQLAEIPVVMLSTCNSDQHRQLANTLGANAYLTKPYDETNLLATLQTLMDR
ncbi:MAG: response regulator [Acaryochloridaceae cyanobacterium SU_2_1]|nr:response regulator [Acaryochloridaceae cyanobacterium SU_2_1]NJM95311.1 response regulator [Acaryochloridaceae cyanobacterium CSU_5_19]